MHLRPLSSIDPAVVRNGLDVRGWSVIASDGALLGAVAELIVDVEYGAPVYINILPVGQSPHATDHECWIRVPIRHTALDESRHRVLLSDIATLGLGTATAGLASSRGVRF